MKHDGWYPQDPTSQRLLFNADKQPIGYQWVASSGEWDYYRYPKPSAYVEERPMIRVHKETKLVEEFRG